MQQPGSNIVGSGNVNVDVNVMCLKSKDEKQQERVLKVHQALFNEQPDDITFGFMNIIASEGQNLFEELPDIFQSIEYKIQRNQLDQQQKQLCLILCSTACDITKNCIEPISLIKGARNQYHSDVVSMHAPKLDTLYTKMDMKKVTDQYQKDTRTSANPFREIDLMEDADINRLYYVALLESEFRKADCLLVQINNQTSLMDEQRIATRITQVIRRWLSV